jgi:hypothetical protein
MLKRTSQAEADSVMLRALLAGSSRGRRAAARTGLRVRPSGSGVHKLAQPSREGPGESFAGDFDPPAEGRTPPIL